MQLDIRQCVRRSIVPSILLVCLLLPTWATAQGSFGGYFVRTTGDGYIGASGVGLQAAVSFPLIPLSGFAAGERLFPECPVDGCSIWAGSVGLNLAVFPLPIVSPHISAGVVRRRFNEGDGIDPTTDEGIFAGVGVSAGVPGVRGFLEARYEFLDDPFDQWVIRLGVMF